MHPHINFPPLKLDRESLILLAFYNANVVHIGW